MTGFNLDRRLWLAGLTGLLLCLLTVAPAAAQDRRGSRDAGLEDVVDVVNTTRRTITIAGETFAVGESARLFGAEGGRIRLGDLRGTRSGGQGDMVEYWVGPTDRDDRREILRLRVIAGDFE